MLAHLDLADPTVQQSLLALLPLREDEDIPDGGDENIPSQNLPPPGEGGGGAGGGEAQAAGRWPLGQVRHGGICESGFNFQL